MTLEWLDKLLGIWGGVCTTSATTTCHDIAAQTTSSRTNTDNADGCYPPTYSRFVFSMCVQPRVSGTYFVLAVLRTLATKRGTLDSG